MPFAVGRRTAAAVSNLADTGLLFRLARGRLWIGTLTTLLVGIVALNVMELSFGASASSLGRQSDVLKRENSTLTTRLSATLSDQSVQRSATRDGLIQPEPGAIRYVHASPHAAAAAARRLRSGTLSQGPATGAVSAASLVAPPPAATATAPTTTTTTAPATATTTATTTAPATATVPPTAATAPTTATATPPTTPTAPPTTTGSTPPTGGVAAP